MKHQLAFAVIFVLALSNFVKSTETQVTLFKFSVIPNAPGNAMTPIALPSATLSVNLQNATPHALSQKMLFAM
jgi:hypothetical protein